MIASARKAQHMSEHTARCDHAECRATATRSSLTRCACYRAVTQSPQPNRITMRPFPSTQAGSSSTPQLGSPGLPLSETLDICALLLPVWMTVRTLSAKNIARRREKHKTTHLALKLLLLSKVRKARRQTSQPGELRSRCVGHAEWVLTVCGKRASVRFRLGRSGVRGRIGILGRHADRAGWAVCMVGIGDVWELVWRGERDGW